ncbi:MAG: alpha/beta hydrolase [Chitinophagales bacterium]|nr:lysophospholipase [Chitinophagales bacterium]MDW8273059.1 alpha/beta hydrolase [Chitinophagales bacterium]
MNHFQWNWTHKGKKVYAQGWAPPQSKGVVCIVHGFAEFSDRYEHVARFLGAHGYAVLTYDQLGHGKTEGRRGHVDAYDDLLDLVQHIVHEAQTRFPGIPVFLYGHSMGGNVVTNFLLRRQPQQVKAAVVTGPLFKLGFEPPAIKVLLARLMVNIFPAYTEKSNLDAEAISRDKNEVRKYKEHPLTLNVITAGMFIGFYKAASYALAHANDLSVPMLIMHGTADRLTSCKGSEEFAAKHKKGLVTLKLLEGFYHELHNEPEEDRQKVLNYIVNWLNQYI